MGEHQNAESCRGIRAGSQKEEHGRNTLLVKREVLADHLRFFQPDEIRHGVQQLPGETRMFRTAGYPSGKMNADPEPLCTCAFRAIDRIISLRPGTSSGSKPGLSFQFWRCRPPHCGCSGLQQAKPQQSNTREINAASLR